ncbi:hypothetical protein VTN49DRAFT_1403 [Thermomyces lanuginosus]|uniref:uncharacterized protein n=1 Tax=Thermomyces lanuginosus TaxID=5541 RepID=UPI003742B56E
MPRPTQLLLHHHLSQYRGVPYVPRNVRNLSTSSQNRIVRAVENQDRGFLDGVPGYTPRDDVGILLFLSYP